MGLRPEPGNGVGDPVAVSRNGVQFAKDAGYDVVVVDTAGRLAIDAELMDQARNIRDAIDPDEVLLVIDAMIGQDAVNTAVAFNEGVGFDGVVLTKLDGDARGGAALSVREVTGRPIMFASTGEKPEDFEPFHPDRMASRILDMGDILTLIEQAERTFSEEQAAAMADKLATGRTSRWRTSSSRCRLCGRWATWASSWGCSPAWPTRASSSSSSTSARSTGCRPSSSR